MVTAAIPMEALELAARIMIENGGETFRAEDTVERMGHALGLKKVNCFVVPTGIFISYHTDEGEQITSVLRVRGKGTNLSRIDAVNSVSRALTNGSMDREQAIKALYAIENQPEILNQGQMILACMLASVGFCLMFGGNWVDLSLAVVEGLFFQCFLILASRLQMGNLARTLVGSFLMCIIPLQLNHWLHVGNPTPIIAGALMPLLPGLAMTKAVHDIIRGDMISGSSHLLQATLTAALVACGAVFATSLIPSGIDQAVESFFVRGLIGSFLGTMGFSMIMNAPKKSWFLASILGMICYGVYDLALFFGCHDAVAMLIGALLATMLAQFAARKMRMISTIFILLSIVSGVPGLSLYRCMSLLAQGRMSQGLNVGVSAMMSILMIAIAQGVSGFVAKFYPSADLRKR